MKRKIIAIIFVAVAGLLAACSQTSYEPADISDSDQCYTCHMGIEDLQSVSQTLLTDGTPRVFDDIGCMLVYLQETNDGVEISYVIDHDSGEWIDMKDAYFVHDQMVQTPMSYGFIAFSSAQEAEAYAASTDHGELLTSEEVLAIDRAALDEWYKGHEDEHHE